MRATFGCGTPRAAAGAKSAILFVAQTDVASTVTYASAEGRLYGASLGVENPVTW